MNTLEPGGRLGVGQELRSDNGLYVLTMQGDGNLVLYEGIASPPWRAVWATDTWNLPPLRRPIRADMQQDGNFVLYSEIGPEWASSTHTFPGSRLVLQDDRNLVIYDSNNTARWASNTWIPAQPRPSEPVRASKMKEEVGHGKFMSTEAILYRDGRLIISTATNNGNWVGGLHGHVLVVGRDVGGRAILVSQDHACTTRCSVPDLSCASNGKETFSESFPDVFARYTVALEVYHSDGASFADIRQSTINAIRGVRDVAKELMDAIASVFG